MAVERAAGCAGVRARAPRERRGAEEGAGRGGRAAPRVSWAGWAAPSAGAMAQRVQSVQEFLQDSFVPLVAALCSDEAERVTRKNNLGFCELVKPFCRLTSEGRCPTAGAELAC